MLTLGLGAMISVCGLENHKPNVLLIYTMRAYGEQRCNPLCHIPVVTGTDEPQLWLRSSTLWPANSSRQRPLWGTSCSITWIHKDEDRPHAS